MPGYIWVGKLALTETYHLWFPVCQPRQLHNAFHFFFWHRTVNLLRVPEEWKAWIITHRKCFVFWVVSNFIPKRLQEISIWSRSNICVACIVLTFVSFSNWARDKDMPLSLDLVETFCYYVSCCGIDMLLFCFEL